MSNFNNKSFLKNDDYMTPLKVWYDIKHLIPKNKVIWECFYGDGKSGDYLRSLDFKVIHEEIDFFENDKGDIIVSNPPFSQIPKILNRLVNEIKKPFILIMPVSKITTQYFRNIFKGVEKPQLIIPKKRINFGKKDKTKSTCNFDCFYYCWKMNLENDITWL